MNILTLTRAVLDQALREPGLSLDCPVGWSRWGDHKELVVGEPSGRPISELFLRLMIGDDFSLPGSLPEYCAGLLVIGRGWRRGQAAGWIDSGSGPEPVQRLKLVGTGMHVISLEGGEPTPSPGPRGDPQFHLDPLERWSRTIGALGLDAWQRLVGLTYGLIGAGRTGSGLAQMMTEGWGIDRLMVVDPDLVESHNLGEMSGVDESDLGVPKAQAVASRLRASSDRLDATIVLNSITDSRALRAVQSCDVLFGCVDHDGARLASSILAALFLKPYIDIASGVHGAARDRRMGADVRLVLPGRCLLCMGGLANPGGARDALASAERERSLSMARDWRAERAGSLRSLNQLAASVAARLWEDFIVERVSESTWARIEIDPAGRIDVSYPRPAPIPLSCPVCREAGAGESGLALVSDMIREARTNEPN